MQKYRVSEKNDPTGNVKTDLMGKKMGNNNEMFTFTIFCFYFF